MARSVEGLQAREDQIVVSGPCIAGRKTAMQGGMEELSGADVVFQLPAATASADGKMTKEQAQSVVNSAVAGSSGQVQYNDNGALGANSDFSWNKISKILDILNGSVQTRNSILGHKVGFKTAGTVDALPRAAFAIGSGVPVTNVALWVYPDTGNTQTPSSVAILTNINTATSSTKRLDITQTTSLSTIISSSGTANTAGTDLALYTYGNASQLFLKNNGNTGAGNNNPSGRFDIHGAGTTTGITLRAADSDGDAKFTVLDNGLLTTSGGSVVDSDTFTADTTLTQTSKSCAVINPSGTGMVLTMHLSPADGIKQRTVNVSAFAVTLGRNSQKMAGLEANYTLPACTAIDWQYYGATIGWIPISISTW